MKFCAYCGAARVEGVNFCASCGHAYDPVATEPQSQTKKRQSNPVVVIALAVLVLVGGLYVMNNTTIGISFKCHVLGDYGACLLESFTQPGTIENILDDIGRSV
jgi:hypothetical protein